MNPSDEDDRSLLILVLDASQSFWGRREALRQKNGLQVIPSTANRAHATFQETLEAVMTFLQSYLMLNRMNEIAFLAMNEKGSSMIYPTEHMVREGVSLSGGGISGKVFFRCLEEGIKEMTTHSNKVEEMSRGTISNALGMGLCYANRIQGEIAGKPLQVWSAAKI